MIMVASNPSNKALVPVDPWYPGWVLGSVKNVSRHPGGDEESRNPGKSGQLAS